MDETTTGQWSPARARRGYTKAQRQRQKSRRGRILSKGQPLASEGSRWTSFIPNDKLRQSRRKVRICRLFVRGAFHGNLQEPLAEVAIAVERAAHPA